jgi:predicted nucleotide-binding protein
MTSMNLLEKEILKYETKGFELKQKRTQKYGTRAYLKKERFLGFEGIYLYYVDGNPETETIRDCLKDYAKFYEDEDFGDGDKGFLMVSGSVDEKLFRDLKKAMIRDDDIRNSIKLISAEKKTESGNEEKEEKGKGNRQIFMVHGRDKAPALELARFIEKKYPIDAIFLQEEAHRGRTLIEKLEEYSGVDYALITLTPDDVGALKGEKLRDRSRQNVIFELGQFIGKIGRKNVCLLIEGDVELPSDLHGIGYLSFTKGVKECFSDVETELKAAKII